MLLPPFDQCANGSLLLRGNLHGHSNASDGAVDPARVAETYKDLGYDFICISDHLWRGEDWSSDQVTDTRDLSTPDFCLVQGAELHCRGKAHDSYGVWHILANGLPNDFPVATETEIARELVERAKGAGAFVTIAHPEWYAMSNEEARTLVQADAVEVYNNSCALECDRGNGMATAEVLLNEGHRMSFIATDDSHFHHQDWGGGWVMVGAARNEEAAIIDALKAGNFYSSTGADLHQLELNEGILSLKCSPANAVIVGGQGDMALKASGPKRTKAQFDLRSFESPWFRVTIVGDHGERAWSNPFWFDEFGDAI